MSQNHQKRGFNNHLWFSVCFRIRTMNVFIHIKAVIEYFPPRLAVKLMNGC